MAGSAKTPSRANKRPWLKPGIALGALMPLAVLAIKLVRRELGADPVAMTLNQLGLLALIFLLASLTTTPLKILFGSSWAAPLRRMLGLFAFFYATLHFLTYVAVDQRFAWSAIVKDVTERKFITVGFLALMLLVPLAATLTTAMQKRLGGLRWRRLHRLSYVAATFATLHFVWRVKRDLSQPVAYALVLAALFSIRLIKKSSKPLPQT